MKIEARGKYAGVKVHLDGDEGKLFLQYAQGDVKDKKVIEFASRLGEKIRKLVKEIPNLLEDRSEDQVKAALLKDQGKIEEQLAALDKGKDWKAV